MIAYIDSSVVLRVILGQPNRLAEWGSITRGITSALLEVECLRTLDRLRLSLPQLSADDFAARRAAIFRVVEGLEIVDVSPSVLRQAAQPMPTPPIALALAKLVIVRTPSFSSSTSSGAPGVHG